MLFHHNTVCLSRRVNKVYKSSKFTTGLTLSAIISSTSEVMLQRIFKGKEISCPDPGPAITGKQQWVSYPKDKNTEKKY